MSSVAERPTARNFALLHLSFFVYSLVAVCAKSAANNAGTLWLLGAFVCLEVLALGCYALLWQKALKHFPLVPAYSNKGVVVLWNLVWAVVLFGESVTPENLIGASLVIAGIVVVSADAT
jgi:drug/metabolite transporter (DMT)-like permease